MHSARCTHTMWSKYRAYTPALVKYWTCLDNWIDLQMSENVFPNSQGLQYIGYNYSILTFFDKMEPPRHKIDAKWNSIGHIYKISFNVVFVHVWLHCTHKLSWPSLTKVTSVVDPSQFWYGSWSGSMDPCLWLTNPAPDPAPDPPIFASDLQNSKTKIF